MKSVPKLLLPLVFLLVALFYLLFPFLSGWFEIVNPVIARNVFIPIDWFVLGLTLPFFRLSETLSLLVPDIVFGLVLFAYVCYYAVVSRRQWTGTYKRLALAPIVVCCLLWIAMLPLGYTYYGRGWNSYQVGGWSRLVLSGGPSKVRSKALEFMAGTTQDSPPESEWPESLQKLGYWIRIEHNNHLVLVGLGSVIGMADEFGFIIQSPEAPPPLPDYFQSKEYHRLSRLAEGIYFFQR